MTIDSINKTKRNGFLCPHTNQSGICMICVVEYLKIASRKDKE